MYNEVEGARPRPKREAKKDLVGKWLRMILWIGHSEGRCPGPSCLKKEFVGDTVYPKEASLGFFPG